MTVLLSFESPKFQCIPVVSIREPGISLRSEYDEESLEELSLSLKDYGGVVQPIVVVALENDEYELIIGARRLRAATRNGQENINAIVVVESSPLNYLLLALTENLHRNDLNAFEEGRAFLRLMKDYGLGIQEIAAHTRKGSHYVTSRIQLLSLPEEVQSYIAGKKLSLSFAPILAKLSSGEEQVFFAQKAATERLNPVELRAFINRETGSTIAPRAPTPGLSAEKARTRIDMFTQWLKKLPYKTVIRKLNTTERNVIAQALNVLEIEIRTIRHAFLGAAPSSPPSKSVPATSNLLILGRNSGVEWPPGDLEKIVATNRPSDQELSRSLGRTISAIRAMRYKIENPGKRKTN